MEESTTKNLVNKLFCEYRPLLSSDTVQSVEHYLDHDEWEIAFEGLCLDLMEGRSVHARWGG